jgi:hypothetical protein
MKSKKIKFFMISIFLTINYSNAQPLSSEKNCTKYVKIQEKAWEELVGAINKKGWVKENYPIIRTWDKKQQEARKNCSEKNGYLYEDIIILNKRVREFGQAGGFKINY